MKLKALNRIPSTNLKPWLHFGIKKIEISSILDGPVECRRKNP